MTHEFVSNLLDQPYAEAFGWTLVHSLWELALIGAVAAAVLALMRRAPARGRYVVALAGLLLMALAPAETYVVVMPRVVPLQTFSAAPPFEASSAQSPAAADATRAITPALPLTARVLAAVRASLPAAETLYLAGLLLCAVRLAVGYARLRSLVRRAHPVGGQARAALAGLAGRVGLRRAVRLLESPLMEVPAVIGFLRPAILLPVTGLTGLSPQQLEAILAHELAHIRRYDHLMIHVQTLIEAVLFHHPAVWWLSPRVRQERENCCDDVAVALTGNAVDYARALATLERLRTVPVDVPPHLVAAARSGVLLPRIRRLLNSAPGPSRPAGQAVSGLVIIAALAALLYAVGCAQKQNTNAVVARPATQPVGPQVLMKILIMSVDDDYLAAQFGAAAPPAAGTANNAAPHELLAKLGDKNHVEIISRPYILSADAQLARMQIGQQVPVSAAKPIQYAFAGIQVDTTPHIAPDGQSVRIDFAFEVSHLLPGTTTQVAGQSVPIIDRRTGNASFELANGDTGILWGPDDLPVAGKPKRHLVITITPHIALDAVTLPALTQPASAAVPVFKDADPDHIPLTDDIRTQIIPLKNLKASDLVKELRLFMSADADISASPDSNAIVITDTSAKIHRLAEIVQQADAKKSAATIEYRQLINTNAVDAARLLNAMYPPANVGVSSNGPRVLAQADARTNTVTLTGPPEQVQQALDMLTRIEEIPLEYNPAAPDARGDPTRDLVLRERARGDMTPVLNQIFGGSGTTQPGTGNRGTSGRAPAPASLPSTGPAGSEPATTLPATQPGATATPPAASERNNTPKAATEYRQLINSNAVDMARLINAMFAPTKDHGTAAGTQPAASLLADADSRTNTVVLTGDPEQVKQALDIINKMEAVPVNNASGGPVTTMPRNDMRNIPGGASTQPDTDANGQPTRDLVLREPLPIGNRDDEARLRQEVLQLRLRNQRDNAAVPSTDPPSPPH